MVKRQPQLGQAVGRRKRHPRELLFPIEPIDPCCVCITRRAGSLGRAILLGGFALAGYDGLAI